MRSLARVAMPFIPTHPVRIQPYFGYRTNDRLLVSARALRSRRSDFKKSSRWRAVRTMLGQFASHEVADLPVELELRRSDGTEIRHKGVTDAEGFVRFDVALDPAWEMPAHSEWDVVSFHWMNVDGAQCVQGHVLAPGAGTGLAVISDIDDTIIETGITGDVRAVLSNWKRVVAQLPGERMIVPGADAFYNALGGGTAVPPEQSQAGEHLPATKHPFFYVSSSPWNLYSYLVAYQKSRGLPLGPIALRDWGLDRKTFGKSSHGSHKKTAIKGILATYPAIRFALIGDDTQGDLTAFADIVADHSEQIRAVFIRRAGEAFSPEEDAAKATIKAANVPLWLGDDYATGHEFLTAIGLGNDGEAEKIVENIAEVGAAAGTEAASGSVQGE